MSSVNCWFGQDYEGLLIRSGLWGTCNFIALGLRKSSLVPERPDISCTPHVAVCVRSMDGVMAQCSRCPHSVDNELCQLSWIRSDEYSTSKIRMVVVAPLCLELGGVSRHWSQRCGTQMYGGEVLSRWKMSKGNFAGEHWASEVKLKRRRPSQCDRVMFMTASFSIEKTMKCPTIGSFSWQSTPILQGILVRYTLSMSSWVF